MTNRDLVRRKERRRIPGTHLYKKTHGIGLPGLVHYLGERTRQLWKQREIIRTKLLQVDEEIKQLEKELNGKRQGNN